MRRALVSILVVASCSTEPPRKHRSDDDERPNAQASGMEATASASAPPEEMLYGPRAIVVSSAARPARPRATSATVAPSGGPSASAPSGGDPDPVFGIGTIRSTGPAVRMGTTTVTGRLPPEVIRRILLRNVGRFRLCYEEGLRKAPTLEGGVTVHFTIGTDGSVRDVKDSGDLPDKGVVDCVSRAFSALSFPRPDSGTVEVGTSLGFTSGAPPAAWIHGKAVSEVTAADVEAALKDIGCTDISSRTDAGTHWVVFTVKKDKRTFTISFASASGPLSLTPSQLEAFEKRNAVVRREGRFFLAVESDDKAASQSLLDAIVQTKAP